MTDLMQRRCVPIGEFGRDHYSTLAYVGVRARRFGGRLDPSHMRTAKSRHPQKAAVHHAHQFFGRDKPTLLMGGTALPGHDDWDCLDDLIDAGLVQEAGESAYVLTDLGADLHDRLVKHRRDGGTYATFSAMIEPSR